VAYINPNRFVFGSTVPNWLASRKEISPGAKLCYALLLTYAVDQGQASPERQRLAAELGVSARQVDRYIGELASEKLIEVVRRGLTKSNVYLFLNHPWASEKENDQGEGQ
jgi:hypothetical protein